MVDMLHRCSEACKPLEEALGLSPNNPFWRRNKHCYEPDGKPPCPTKVYHEKYGDIKRTKFRRFGVKESPVTKTKKKAKKRYFYRSTRGKKNCRLFYRRMRRAFNGDQSAQRLSCSCQRRAPTSATRLKLSASHSLTVLSKAQVASIPC